MGAQIIPHDYRVGEDLVRSAIAPGLKLSDRVDSKSCYLQREIKHQSEQLANFFAYFGSIPDKPFYPRQPKGNILSHKGVKS